MFNKEVMQIRIQKYETQVIVSTRMLAFMLMSTKVSY